MSSLNFPKIGDKSKMKAVFTPKDAITVSDSKELSKMPKRAIIIYSEILESHLKKGLSLSRYDLPFSSHFHRYLNITPYIDKENSVLVLRIGIGAPVTAIIAEDLISMGVKDMLLLGSAGGIGRDLSLGDIVLCTKALRDEGTSHHYIENSKFIDSDLAILQDLEKGIKDIKIKKGPTWSTDALYAETKEELDTYSKEGVLTVEMEASALFSVARKRFARAAAAFMVSDLVNGQSWSGLKENELEEGFSNLVKIADIYRKIG